MPNELFIRIDGGEIVIEDARGTRGGDLKVSTGDEVRWINATQRTCHLMFRELRLGPTPGYGGRVWPFGSDDPGGGLNIPPAGWSGTIRKDGVSPGPNAAYVKYDVKVTGGGPPLDLDPIIIIEN
jgi:hypothetical protein